jgi:hypothetical protein
LQLPSGQSSVQAVSVFPHVATHPPPGQPHVPFPQSDGVLEGLTRGSGTPGVPTPLVLPLLHATMATKKKPRERAFRIAGDDSLQIA